MQVNGTLQCLRTLLGLGLAAAPQSREVVCRSRDVDESHSLPPAPSHFLFKAKTLFTMAPFSFPTRSPWTDYRIDNLGVGMRACWCVGFLSEASQQSLVSPLFPMLLFFQNRIAARPKTDRTSQGCTKNSDHAELQVGGTCGDIWLCGPRFTQLCKHLLHIGWHCSLSSFQICKLFTFRLYCFVLRFLSDLPYKVAFVCVFIYFCISETAPGLSWC